MLLPTADWSSLYNNYTINCILWNTIICSLSVSGVYVMWCLSAHYSGAHSASSSTRPTTTTTSSTTSRATSPSPSATSGEYLWGVHTHTQRHSLVCYILIQTLLHLLREWVDKQTHLLHTQIYLHTGSILLLYLVPPAAMQCFPFTFTAYPTTAADDSRHTSICTHLHTYIISSVHFPKTWRQHTANKCVSILYLLPWKTRWPAK